MDFDQVSCRREIEQNLQNKSNGGSLHKEAYDAKPLNYPRPADSTLNLPGLDLAQEARTLGIMLDSGGNAQLVASRLQNDLFRLRPDRNAQNSLLNMVGSYERKGIGSDLVLSYYDQQTQSYLQRYIIPSASRPYPTYPLMY
jgi:hypothetical protein